MPFTVLNLLIIDIRMTSWGLARDMLMLICQYNSRNQARLLNEQKKRAGKTLKLTPGRKKNES